MIRGEWAHLFAPQTSHEFGTVKDRHSPTCRSVVESVARAQLLTAALMPAEPHIRSPFSERLAPQSLILEVIGLGRMGPHCIAAYRSHSHEFGTVKDRHSPTCRSVVESVARAQLLTAALMPAEPHIRSPFSERLAPQSLILEVI